MTIQELYEQKRTAVALIRELASLIQKESRDFTAEERSKWDAANSDVDSSNAQIETLERTEELASERLENERANERLGAELERGSGGVAHENRLRAAGIFAVTRSASHGYESCVDLALQAWGRRGCGLELEERHTEALRVLQIPVDLRGEFPLELLNTAAARSLARAYTRSTEAGREDAFDDRFSRIMSRAQSTSATEGGETIPAGFVNNFEKALLSFGGVRQNAHVMRTASGNDLPWPYVDDTSNEGAILAENVQDAEVDIVTGSMTLEAYKYTSKIIRVSVELLEDSAFDLGAELGSMLGERISRGQNGHFTTGTGTAQPKGIVVASVLGKTAATNAAITAEELIDLQFSVDAAYRERAGWMMHDTTVGHIRKLKIASGTDDFVWRPGLIQGVPDTILGHRFTVNNKMAVIATIAKTVLFGDFSKYKIRDVRSLRLRRLVERYADYDQVGFVAFHRTDGDLLNAGTDPVKHLIQAA